MNKDNKKYNITDEQLHEFIIKSYEFVEDYSKIYSKIFIAYCVIERLDSIPLDDVDVVDVYTTCLYDIISDIFTCANNLYLKSDDVNYSNYGGVDIV